MTALGPVPSWLNKQQPRSTWPEWVEAKASKVEANGTFLIETDLGRVRVHVGWMVFDWKGKLKACPPEEARQIIEELRAADQPVPVETKNVGGRPAGRPPRWQYKPGATTPEWLEAWIDDDAIGADGSFRFFSGLVARPGDTVVLEKDELTVIPAPTPRAAPISAPKKVKPARGSMPSIEWVQLNRLLVDDAYQRSTDTGPSRALIARIGGQWDWRLCVPLMVSRRDDGLYVIDGQHRLFGARLRSDVPQLPCCISKYDGPADEAAMFVAANRERRAMNRLDDFHAAQVSGDEDAQAIAALITEVGFTVSRKTGSAAWVPGEVAFTSAIAKVRRKHGDGIVSDALRMMADAFPDERLVAGSSVFTALCRVLITPPTGFDRGRLFAALKTFDMKGWASFLSGSKGGTDRDQKLRDMLLAAYDDVAKAAA